MKQPFRETEGAQRPDGVQDAGDTCLGHGSHWSALGFAEAETLLPFLEQAVSHADSVEKFAPPWPGSPFTELLHREWRRGGLSFVTIEAVCEKEKVLRMLSAFPLLSRTEDWVVQVDGVEDSYGPVEGVVLGTAASGHPLQWFAPRFGLEAKHWRRGGVVRVAVAALAVSLARFPAEPFRVSEGPMVEMERERLRQEGCHDEAEAEDLAVTVEMSSLRTLYSSFHDHHQFVGEIVSVHPICPLPELRGWLLELVCLPDDLETGRVIPLYVFPPALEEGYEPQCGEVVQGVAWLQGTWKGRASRGEVARFQKLGGHP